MSALEDADYDVIVIDANSDANGVWIDLTITTGARKGEVVRVRTTHDESESTALLGLPATLVVRGGQPRVVLDS